MGGMPWETFTRYQEDLQKALIELRHEEFLAATGQTGKKLSVDEIEDGIAMMIEEADADGTCSIIDIFKMHPEPDRFAPCEAHPLSSETLKELFGTDKPTRSDLSKNNNFSKLYNFVSRGEAVYVITYDDNGKPSEIHFAGYSFD